MACLQSLLLVLLCGGSIGANYVYSRDSFLYQRKFHQDQQMTDPRIERDAVEAYMQETHVKPEQTPLVELKRTLEALNKVPSRVQVPSDSEGPIAWYEPQEDDSELSYDKGEKDCTDRFSGCHKFADNYQCWEKQYEKWMKVKCRKTCDFCECWETKYGCCEDGKTPADGPGLAGCGVKLCSDQVECKKYKDKGDCDNSSLSREFKTWLKNKCAFTCGYCKAASPKKDCEARKPPYGCCWNGDEATGWNNQGCIPCNDVYKRACYLYRDGCASPFYKTRNFMQLSCPKTCGKCGECVDNSYTRVCVEFERRGLCFEPGWENIMIKNCAMTCGFCEGHSDENVGARSYLGLQGLQAEHV